MSANATSEEWAALPLVEVAEVNPRWPMEPDPQTRVSVVPMKAVGAMTGRLDASEVAPIAETKKGLTRFIEGDVLLAKITPSMENGKVAVAQGLANELGVGTTEFHVLRPKGVHPRYLMYFFFQDSVRGELRRHMKGTAGQLRVPAAYLSAITLPVPSEGEQAAIVELIEKQFTRLDAGAASLRRANANLRRYRSALYQAAVEGAITGGTHDWNSVQLSDVAAIQGGIQKQPKRTPRNNAYPYLRVANVLKGRLDLSEMKRMELFGDELEKLRLHNGDLLIVEGNGSIHEIGRMAIWKDEIANCVHQNHIIRARPGDGVDPRWAMIYWNSPVGRSEILKVASSTSGLYTLSVSKVSRLPLPFPPLDEQLEIVEDIERRVSLLSALQQEAEIGLRRSEGLRQSILSSAFSGRLVRKRGRLAKGVGV